MSKGSAPKAYENGNWQCFKCFNVNYAYRTECNRCKEPRATAVDSYGPYSAQQGFMTNWDCPKCGNVNYPRRTKCNRCAEPRPTEHAISSSPYSPPQYSSPISISSLDLNMDYKLKLAHQFLSLFSNEINPMDSAVKCLMAVENWQLGSPQMMGHIGSLSPSMGPLSYDSKEGGAGGGGGGGGLSPLQTEFLSGPMKQRRRTGAAPVAGVDGNWKCTDVSCGNVNFPKRTHCNRCHKERTPEQAQLADKFLSTMGSTSPESGSTPASPVSVSGTLLANSAVGSSLPHSSSQPIPLPNGSGALAHALAQQQAAQQAAAAAHNSQPNQHLSHHAILPHHVLPHGGLVPHPHSSHPLHNYDSGSGSESGSPIGSLATLSMGHNIGSPVQSDGGLLLDGHDDELHAHTTLAHSVSGSDPGSV